MRAFTTLSCVAVLAGTAFGGLLPPAGTGNAIITTDNPTIQDTVDIIAGQNYDAGDIIVWTQGQWLHVRFVLHDGWTMSQSHFAVAASPELLPRNGEGDLVPGQFPYQNAHDPEVTEYTYVVPITGFEPGDTLALAAHVVVSNGSQVETGWGHTWKGWWEYTIPDCLPDVGAIEILVPRGRVYLNTVHRPRAVIKEFGGSYSVFPTTMRIGTGYTQTIQCTLNAYQTDTVEFLPDWTAQPLGVHQTVCFTDLSVDYNRTNDTAWGEVEVYTEEPYHDVGAVVILSPTGVLDSGTVTTPRAIIHNYGEADETFPVTLRIGTSYEESRTRSLTVGQTDTVDFPDWIADPVGIHATVCFTDLGRDQDRSNDTAWGEVEVVSLPVRHDVGTDRVVWPIGLVSLGTTQAPTAVIVNHGEADETFQVTFRIDSIYADSLVTSLAVGETATVSFRDWTAQPIGHRVAVCYTQLATDEDRSNDTAWGEFCVIPPRHDVGAINILAPTGTVNLGTAVTPQARIGNYGDVTEVFPVTFAIDDDSSRVVVCTLAAGQTTTLDFPIWTASPLGVRSLACYTGLASDTFHFNDTAYGEAEVVTTPYHDVGTLAILSPVGVVDSGTIHVPSARIANFGNQRETFPVTLSIGAGYSHTLPSVTLDPGDTTVVYFQPWTATTPGSNPTVCFTGLTGDERPSNDTARGFVFVRRMVPRNDVGVVTILVPRDTVDSGTVLSPLAVVRRYVDFDLGSAKKGHGELDDPISFPVTMAIGGTYLATALCTLDVNSVDTIEFSPTWTAEPLGEQACTCYTQLVGDLNPANDTAYGTVFVTTAADHDVGAIAILTPSGEVDSGSVHTPAAMITNWGNRSETFPVTFTIGTGYAHTLPAVTLEPGDTARLYFRPWTATPLGPVATSCFTELVGDFDPSNDTAHGTATVVGPPEPHHDVGATAILVPTDTVDSGTVHTPTAIVRNFGDQPETFPVTFKIGTEYSQTVTHTLDRGATDTVIFPYWVALLPYEQPMVCYTDLEGDEDRLNDSVFGTVTVVATENHDVGAVRIRIPSGIVDSGTVHIPTAVVRNFGNRPEAFPVYFGIGVDYLDSTPTVTLLPHRDTTVTFSQWTAAPVGKHLIVCYTALDRDQNRANDTVVGTVEGGDSVEVVAPPRHDVSVDSILIPTGTVEFGSVHTPTAVVTNRGNRTETCPVSLVIGDDGSRTTTVTLLPQASQQVTFDHWLAQKVGSQPVICYVSLEGDEDPSNDTARAVVEVPAPNHDVGAEAILAPTGTVKVSEAPWSTPVEPRAQIRNHTDLSESNFDVRLRIALREISGEGQDTIWNTVYDETRLVAVLAGNSMTELSFPETDLGFGYYTISCSTMLANDADRSNDAASASFLVSSGPRDPEAEVEIRIYTRAGEFVRRFSYTRTDISPPWIDWDGTNDQGRTVAPGTYVCLMSSKASQSGETVNWASNVLVPRQAARVRISVERGAK